MSTSFLLCFSSGQMRSMKSFILVLAMVSAVGAGSAVAGGASMPRLTSKFVLPLRSSETIPSAPFCCGNLALRGGFAGPVQLKAEEVLHCDNLLGEAPMYNSAEHALYWLDINGKKLWRLDAASGESNSWSLPEVAGSFAFAQGGGFLMGFTSGLAWFNADTGATQKICDYEDGLNTRANDGKCDYAGNWVIGGYNNNHRTDKLNITGLWRLNANDMSLQEVLDYRFRCSNTIAFSPDGTSIYFCDTPTREIMKFKYSPTGKLSEGRLLWSMPSSAEGGPDGATIDSEGGLWEAQAGNWKVVRHNGETGEVDYEVVLPMNNPTSCAIGGTKMDTLYITTARHRLTEEERAKQPGAGQLWAVKLPEGIKGLPEPHFAARSPIQ